MISDKILVVVSILRSERKGNNHKWTKIMNKKRKKHTQSRKCRRLYVSNINRLIYLMNWCVMLAQQHKLHDFNEELMLVLLLPLLFCYNCRCCHTKRSNYKTHWNKKSFIIYSNLYFFSLCVLSFLPTFLFCCRGQWEHVNKRRFFIFIYWIQWEGICTCNFIFKTHIPAKRKLKNKKQKTAYLYN